MTLPATDFVVCLIRASVPRSFAKAHRCCPALCVSTHSLSCLAGGTAFLSAPICLYSPGQHGSRLTKHQLLSGRNRSERPQGTLLPSASVRSLLTFVLTVAGPSWHLRAHRSGRKWNLRPSVQGKVRVMFEGSLRDAHHLRSVRFRNKEGLVIAALGKAKAFVRGRGTRVGRADRGNYRVDCIPSSRARKRPTWKLPSP